MLRGCGRMPRRNGGVDLHTAMTISAAAAIDDVRA
jgi:hypothetical protein